MDVEGTEVRESEYTDGYAWRWTWPRKNTKVERELRWAQEKNEFTCGMRVDEGGWTWRPIQGQEWADVRTIDNARFMVEGFVRWDLDAPPQTDSGESA